MWKRELNWMSGPMTRENTTTVLFFFFFKSGLVPTPFSLSLTATTSFSASGEGFGTLVTSILFSLSLGYYLQVRASSETTKMGLMAEADPVIPSYTGSASVLLGFDFLQSVAWELRGDWPN